MDPDAPLLKRNVDSHLFDWTVEGNHAAHQHR
jgi:hypothetical protein